MDSPDIIAARFRFQVAGRNELSCSEQDAPSLHEILPTDFPPPKQVLSRDVPAFIASLLGNAAVGTGGPPKRGESDR